MSVLSSSLALDKRVEIPSATCESFRSPPSTDWKERKLLHFLQVISGEERGGRLTRKSRRLTNSIFKFYIPFCCLVEGVDAEQVSHYTTTKIDIHPLNIHIKLYMRNGKSDSNL